ncbi:hypothetical protein [Pseudomonas putida]|uniref:hypothetical protein n=1 Tax=Pseudomonas putida TaxID=303 RepID=UPI0023640A74|nr:hypothetical protein [Pseudomonas putida]
MDNELFYEPEDGFWLGDDQLEFEANNLEPEWTKPTNVFIQKMADPTRLGNGIQDIAFADFKQVVGALVHTDPSATYRFMVIPLHRSGQRLSVQLISTATGEYPPLRADNACSLSKAVEWMANRASRFEVSFAAGGTYWVHKQ